MFQSVSKRSIAFQNTSRIQAEQNLRLMITTRFYLDRRSNAPGSPAPLKLVLTHKGVLALISLNISVLPSQWDSHRQIVIGHPWLQNAKAMQMHCKCKNLTKLTFLPLKKRQARAVEPLCYYSKLLLCLFAEPKKPQKTTATQRQHNTLHR